MEEETTGIEPAQDEIEDSSPQEISEDATDEQEQEGEEVEQQEEKPRKKTAQDRINELTWQREEEKRQREEERQRADRLEQMVQELVNKNKPQEPEQVKYPETPPVPPDRYQYDDDEQYSQAMQQYQQGLALFVQGQNRRAQEELLNNVTKHRQQQTVEDFINETVTEGKAKYDDFDRVGFIPRGMEGVFAQAANPVDIAYKLGTDRAERARILSLPPQQIVFEIAKMDAQFSAPQQKKTTEAPPPVKPVGGKESASNDWLNDPNISPEEFARRRNKQIYG